MQILVPNIYRDVVQYCFGSLIQSEGNEFAVAWNNHRIRQSRMADAPGGRPEILYHLPNLHGV